MTISRITDCVQILSGGLDSCTLLHYLVRVHDKKPLCIFFNYGQRQINEYDCAQWQTELLNVPLMSIDIRAIYDVLTKGSALTDNLAHMPTEKEFSESAHSSVVVPFRNALMLTVAAAVAEVHANARNTVRVYYGAHASDDAGYWDCRPAFVSAINRMFSLNTKRVVETEAPFLYWEKSSIVALGNILGVDFTKTYTCYRGGATHCGLCPSCAGRKESFIFAGVADPTEYCPAND